MRGACRVTYLRGYIRVFAHEPQPCTQQSVEATYMYISYVVNNPQCPTQQSKEGCEVADSTDACQSACTNPFPQQRHRPGTRRNISSRLCSRTQLSYQGKFLEVSSGLGALSTCAPPRDNARTSSRHTHTPSHTYPPSSSVIFRGLRSHLSRDQRRGE